MGCNFLKIHFGLSASSSIQKIESKAVNFIIDEKQNKPISDKDDKCYISKLEAKCNK